MKIYRRSTRRYKFARRNAKGDIITTIASKLIFTVREKPDDCSKVLLQKTLKDMTFDSEGYYHVILTPKDTNLCYGKYYYSVWAYADDTGDTRTPIKTAGVFEIAAVVPDGEEA